MAPVPRLTITSNRKKGLDSLHGRGRKLKWVLGGCLAILSSARALVVAQEPPGSQGVLEIHSFGGTYNN